MARRAATAGVEKPVWDIYPMSLSRKGADFKDRGLQGPSGPSRSLSTVRASGKACPAR